MKETFKAYYEFVIETVIGGLPHRILAFRKMNYRIYEVKEVISEMDLSEVEYDIAETDEDKQLVISGLYVHIPNLNLNLREGVVCIWDEEEMYMPDTVTVIYEGDIEVKDWIYYE